MTFWAVREFVHENFRRGVSVPPSAPSQSSLNLWGNSDQAGGGAGLGRHWSRWARLRGAAGGAHAAPSCHQGCGGAGRDAGVGWGDGCSGGSVGPGWCSAGWWAREKSPPWRELWGGRGRPGRRGAVCGGCYRVSLEEARADKPSVEEPGLLWRLFFNIPCAQDCLNVSPVTMSTCFVGRALYIYLVIYQVFGQHFIWNHFCSALPTAWVPHRRQPWKQQTGWDGQHKACITSDINSELLRNVRAEPIITLILLKP